MDLIKYTNSLATTLKLFSSIRHAMAIPMVLLNYPYHVCLLADVKPQGVVFRDYKGLSLICQIPQRGNLTKYQKSNPDALNYTYMYLSKTPNMNG